MGKILLHVLESQVEIVCMYLRVSVKKLEIYGEVEKGWRPLYMLIHIYIRLEFN